MTDTSRLWHRLLLRAALASSQLFAWIFVFRYFFSYSNTLEAATVSLALTYALTQVVTILLTPLAAHALRNGYRRLMIYAALSLAAAFVLLSISFAGTVAAPLGITGFALLLGIYRALYWIPYRVSAHLYPARKPIWPEYVLAVLPLIVGFVLDGGGVSAVLLLAGAGTLALLSIVPLVNMRDAHEGFSWSYRETFHQLYVRRHRHMTISSVLHGMEMSLLLIVWPIIVFIILGWSFALLGIVLSLIYILSILVRSIIRRPLSGFSAPTRALYAASAWILRLSVVGSISIILVDVYYYGGSNASSRGFDMMTLEHSADNSTFVDEYTALKEIGMAAGRLLMSLAVAFLASNVSVTYTFAIVFFIAAIIAATATLLGGTRARS